jgi:HSP20 family protein
VYKQRFHRHGKKYLENRDVKLLVLLFMAGVRKEDLRVEVEDSKYLIIRTEVAVNEESTEPVRKFERKFRLPGRVDIDGISAEYENGVLTVTVPRLIRRGFHIDPAVVPERLEVLARAA